MGSRSPEIEVDPEVLVSLAVILLHGHELKTGSPPKQRWIPETSPKAVSMTRQKFGLSNKRPSARS